jgi:malonyl CoA-acyl carrier protein transacylase
MARGNPDNLRAAAQRKSQATTKRAETALRTMIKNGEPISFRGVARTANCSIDFLYGASEIRRRIEHLRAQQQSKPSLGTTTADANADSNVIRALTAQLSELRSQHRDEIEQLRAALAAAHGENLQLRRQLGRRADPTPH